MREDLVDDHRIFDAGNHLSRAAAGAARLHIDIEQPFEPLGPGHGHMTLNRCLLV